jgi:phage replication O-like protein O
MPSSPIQKERGHSPIAHPILEALALASLTAGELKIVLVVIRETYGWSRKTAALSLGALAEATGLHKNSVQRSVRTLLSEGVLVELDPATFREPATLTLQKDPRKWGRYAVTPPALTAAGRVNADGDTQSPEGQSTPGGSPRALGVPVERDRTVTVERDSHTDQPIAPQRVPEPENKGKAKGSKDPGDRAQSEAQQLVNRVIEVGLNGESPDDYARQAGRAKQLLAKQPLEYWCRAADAMGNLFPYSDGTAWDVFDLGRKAAKALGSARATARASPNGAGAKDPKDMTEMEYLEYDQTLPD